MSKIVIFGATGYTGANIAREALSRGHEVVGVARNASDSPIAGVKYVAGDLTDAAFFAEAINGADDVVIAVHHSNPPLASLIATLAPAVSVAGARLSVVGGAGSLFVAEGGPRLFDTAEFPDAYKGEAHAAAETLDALKATNGLEWFYVSPAAGYGSFAPGERVGSYRTGGDVLVTDAEGNSFISGADFALAFVDEIEHKKHRNQRFAVAY